MNNSLSYTDKHPECQFFTAETESPGVTKCEMAGKVNNTKTKDGATISIMNTGNIFLRSGLTTFKATTQFKVKHKNACEIIYSYFQSFL